MRPYSRLSAYLFAALALSTLLPAAEEDGFKPIFDGKSLEGWDGDPKFWRVEDGAITGQTTKDNPTKSNTFIIWRDGATVDDFEITLEYRIVGGNSGIQYRSFELEKWVLGGYQADIDASGRFTGILYGERDRGILANRGDKVVIGPDHKPKPAGKVGDSAEIGSKVRKEDWNEYRVIAKGNQLVHRINGVTTMEATDEDPSGRRMRGVLGLQLHAGDPMKVQFRNIRLKRTPLASGKKVVLVAGSQSHGFGAHDHKAGCHLIAERLEASGLGIVPAVYHPGWPKDPTAFDNANAIVVYSDGGGGHPIASRIDEASKLAKKGVGLGFIHYGVEVEKGKVGDAFLEWTGGYFEMHWSVNPHWTIENAILAKDHPITRGVKPYSVNDEWYFHMRFRPGMEGVTPILSAVPPESTMSRPDGTHSGNPAVREAVKKREPQHVMWARQRPDGGRGFGFTGGHDHWNWGHPDHLKLILNAIAWISGVEVPEKGMASKPVTAEELLENHDEERPKNFDIEKIRKQLAAWNAMP